MLFRSRAGEAGAFPRQVVGEVDPLGGHETGGLLLLLGDLCQFALRDTGLSPEESRKALQESRLWPRCQAFRQGVAPPWNSLAVTSHFLETNQG